MSKKRNSLLLVAVAAVVACGLCLCLTLGGAALYFYGLPGADAPSAQPDFGLPSLPGVQTPNARPVGIYEGLASLNSYRLTTRMLFTGPGLQDYSENIQTTSYSQDGDQQYSRWEITVSSADEPERITSITEQYRLDQVYCLRSTSDGETESEVSTTTPVQQSMLDTLLNLFDITIAARDATFVGAETVNGIPSNHFTFTVSGLGSSGAEVTQSQGEYWVAQDGQYLVKYQVTLEMRSGPPDAAAEVVHVELQMELNDVNLPFTLQMPPDCVK